MSKATLTKRIEFCSSHRYHNPIWDDEKNRVIFGPCHNEQSHGHNYLLEATIKGEIDPANGMIMNLYDFKRCLLEILGEFDHKHLNLDTPYFAKTIPTTENLALTLWRLIEGRMAILELDHIRLYEDDTFYADIRPQFLQTSSPSDSPQAAITRVSRFSAGSRTPSGHLTGHNYTVGVTVCGEIDGETGQVTDLRKLDELIQKHIRDRFHDRELGLDPAFEDGPVSEGTLARYIWSSLKEDITLGCLTEISVSEGVGTEARLTNDVACRSK